MHIKVTKPVDIKQVTRIHTSEFYPPFLNKYGAFISRPPSLTSTKICIIKKNGCVKSFISKNSPHNLARDKTQQSWRRQTAACITQVRGRHEKDITNSEEVIYISYNNI